MIELFAGLAAGLLVVMTAVQLRRERERMSALRKVKSESTFKRPDEVFGRYVAKLPLVKKYATDQRRIRTLGQLTIICGVLVLVSRPLALVVAMVLLARPFLADRKVRKWRRSQIQRELPMTTELFRLSVASGLNVTESVRHVTKYTSGPIADEFKIALQKVDQGHRIADAIELAAVQLGDDASPLINALVSAERYGSPLSDSLQRLAEEARRDQERRAEQAGQRLAVQMILPVTVTGLPAFVALTLPPLIAGALPSALHPH